MFNFCIKIKALFPITLKGISVTEEYTFSEASDQSCHCLIHGPPNSSGQLPFNYTAPSMQPMSCTAFIKTF